MSAFLNRAASLYGKSLLVAVPVGAIIGAKEKIFDSSWRNRSGETCAERIAYKSLDCTFSSIAGGMLASAYPVVGTLYVMHKLEKRYPDKFKSC
jgi:hypothetical protein